MVETNGHLKSKEQQNASTEGISVSGKNNYLSIEWNRLPKVFK